MASKKKNIEGWFETRKEVASFVSETLENLPQESTGTIFAWITTTRRGKSEGYSVSIVTP